MNADFQQTYQAAERAYGGRDYKTAHHLASGLLKQLEAEERADNNQVHDAVLGWRAFLALLLAHIELHSRQLPDQAANYYQLTLDCKPQDTLADLAKQGLQRSLFEPEAVQSQEIGTRAVEPSAESLPSMLQDPFLNIAPPESTPGPSQATAMPWLKEISTSLQAKETPAPEPKRIDRPVRSNPDTSEPVMSVNEETSHKEQPLPLLISEESLQTPWLRVSITPNGTGADSISIDQTMPPSRLQRLMKGLLRS